jgi:hypothetical protein
MDIRTCAFIVLAVGALGVVGCEERAAPPPPPPPAELPTGQPAPTATPETPPPTGG